jgi:hypothetical protein
LWNDVVRVAERILRQPGGKHHPQKSVLGGFVTRDRPSSSITG